MKLWPGWLDRIYWRWYLKRHPYHLASPTMRFMWNRCRRDLAEAITLSVGEFGWLETE